MPNYDNRFVELFGDEPVYRLWKELDGAFDPPLSETVSDLRAYASKLAERAVTLACLDEEGRLLGGVSFYANDGAGRCAYVAELATAVDARGRGVGSGLMERAMEESRRLGMASVSLEVRKNNADARRFYDRWGFVLSEERDRTLLLRRSL